MDNAAQSVWEAPTFAGRHPIKAGSDDFPSRKWVQFFLHLILLDVYWWKQVCSTGLKISHIKCATWSVYPACLCSFEESNYVSSTVIQTASQQTRRVRDQLLIRHTRFDLAFTRQIAFLKSYSTSCGQETARDAVQIFGGRGITSTGMGKYIEHVRNPTTLLRFFFADRLMNSIIVPSLSMLSLVAQKMYWGI